MPWSVMQMSQRERPFKIVCFGDSLTLGYLSPTRDSPFPDSIPYGNYLRDRLGDRGQVLVRGVCGETTEDMRRRFQADVLHHVPDIVIILGGTNDLGVGMTSETIMENLRVFYDQAQANGLFPIAVTVPSLREDSWLTSDGDGGVALSEISPIIEQAIAQRVVLNQSLKDYCGARQIPVIDWFAETCEPQTQALALVYSNDGLHLTNTGYRKLAEMIWSQVLEDWLKTNGMD